MKRLLLAALFVLCSSPLFAAPLPSILPLTNETGMQYCTTWSINEERKLWASDEHCLGQDGMRRTFIAGEEAVVVVVDEPNDIIVMRAAVGAPALKVANEPAPIGSWVETDSYPCYAEGKKVHADGYFVARNGIVPSRPQPIHDFVSWWLVSDYQGSYGLPSYCSSGAPVWSVETGEVVGMLWGGYPETALNFLIRVETLLSVLKNYLP